MLRVEASNLPKPRGALRPRRLLPIPPVPHRLAATSRLEIILPRNGASAPETEIAQAAGTTRMPLMERWSVKLELGDEEIAKLYGQGMTRGAVVWKKGMVEWRPLLITPELSGLLHRTRISINELPANTLPLPRYSSPSSPFHDEVTLPRPALVPREVAAETDERAPISTVAPTALDVEAPTKSRKPLEFAAVAVAAFALAWLGHAKLHPGASASANPPLARAAAAVAAAASPVCAPPSAGSSVLASTGIPTVSVADLPLVGAKITAPFESRWAPAKVTGHALRASASGSPSRSELVAALSRVAGAASGCGERSGPVRLVVSFANSGVARSIQVSGADLPAQTRSCIIGAASRARVSVFTGDPVTVAKTL